jgi:hypothetical protein
MNDESRGQSVALRQPGLTCRTSIQPPAFREQFRARRPVDCAVNAAAAKERGIRRVHDRIDLEGRDVGEEKIDPRSHAECTLQR